MYWGIDNLFHAGDTGTLALNAYHIHYHLLSVNVFLKCYKIHGNQISLESASFCCLPSVDCSKYIVTFHCGQGQE